MHLKKEKVYIQNLEKRQSKQESLDFLNSQIRLAPGIRKFSVRSAVLNTQRLLRKPTLFSN